jgi:hypothetical protein
MIRAVRGLPPGDAAFIREYRALKRFWKATPYLESALGLGFRQWIESEETGPRQSPSSRG